jgi:Gamma interferon inducible lysosomal thiol reductase (GILT)
MAGEAYTAYKELVREERFGPRDANVISSTAASGLTTRWDRFLSRYFKSCLLTVCLCSVLYFLMVNRLVVTAPSSHEAGKNTADGADRTSGGHAPAGAELVKKVPLEVHIMSKCPDARDCLQQLIIPTMEQISSKVDFQLSVIGR